ncbi:putative lipoprotein [Escherichia coli EC1846]|uniref:Lipoprotein n=4 Tax=Escherichia coli TaxID=562 RepID=A0A0H3PST1_ECO5C|nr:putative lipoprotein [Escherichia coli O157:H7 str. EC4115]AIF92298.1 putative lipoprotein [Escherichia coli O157:H7 str. SS17]AIG66944.1 putative lipoprotein [Escherichia coli O157:H7 str. EDL933]AJA24657.1 putative lipoprotein [Escherichia coli O157:H7 str. SS52]ASL60921.1 hypothetical protein FORC44_4168 [Escherichia coli]EDU30792.1 hypothetical protein ECH7EC4196_3430 [Escherichia coli O157:H7 str. EC4196]EDU51715.1 hypothetical protein ECH7EC4113_0040 [Escherichia coli O157:H7 str. EC
MISNTPKIEHITFSVNLVFVACCVCLFKKMPQSSTVRKRFGGEKIKNVMVIADL